MKWLLECQNSYGKTELAAREVIFEIGMHKLEAVKNISKSLSLITLEIESPN